MNDVLSPGQKWHSADGETLMTILKVNNENATFAATYEILQDPNSKYPIRGEFDPNGVSIGWVVSYFVQDDVNLHQLGAWAGYIETNVEEMNAIVVTRLITHDGDPASTTIGFDRFMLKD